MSKKKAKKKLSKEIKTVEILDDVKKPKAKIASRSSKSVTAEIVDKERSSKKLPALSDGLSHYLAEINKYPLLTRDQEMEIAKRYRELNNPKDAETLVTANLRFVVKVAAEYSQLSSKLIDLIQEGNVGLMHAVREFNPYKGAKLITYAVWWIRGYIQEYLMKQHSMVRIGTTHNQRKLFYNLQKEKDKLERMGQNPTVALLSDKLGVPERDIQMMNQRMAKRDLSLDQPLTSDEGSTLMDFESTSDSMPDDDLIANETMHLLKEAIGEIKENLSEKEQYILNERLLKDDPLKLQEIGDKWGVTREAVRQMESRLMKKIKKQMLEKQL